MNRKYWIKCVQMNHCLHALQRQLRKFQGDFSNRQLVKIENGDMLSRMFHALDIGEKYGEHQCIIKLS